MYDPSGPRDYRQRFRRDTLRSLEMANSFYCSIGRYPSRGWVLLARSDYNVLDTYTTNLQLNISDTTQPNNIGTLKNLSIVQAQCVTRGLASDPNALYLVELTDARGILCNKWFQFPTTSMYNIRSPAYPQEFYVASMNGSVAWTWSTMLQDLWLQMPLLGAWPTLPSTPAGTPEGFWFTGVSAFTALCDVLDHLGLVIACDLTSNTPFTIVSDGADDPVFTALQTQYLTNLEDDLEWIDTGAGRVPATVKVFFRRRNAIYGTEETVTKVSSNPYQWNMSSLYEISVPAPAFFASAIGTHHIWSDFTIQYDMNNVPSPTDVTTATTIAQERVTQYFDKIYSRTSGYMSQTYAGALPFKTGSQVDGVCYYQDYSSQSRQGWKTKIIRGTHPIWNEHHYKDY